MANRFTDIFKNIENHAIAAASIVVVLMLLIPVPGVLLDLLMIFNIALAIIILLVVLYTPKASDFSSFPRVLLYQTLYGLALNVCSTRLIISRASSYSYQNFPGNMLKAFSSIVTGDTVTNPTSRGLVIGMVIFIILIIIQAIVITKGATRVSEVAARFSLDSMSQKMFAVDSELQSGSINDEEAKRRKAAIQRDIDFYSSMDGASKFVSGNVKAGIFITVVDLVAGIISGMVLKNDHGATLAFGEALNTYSRLTIGDGLLSQLPSLLVSFATGLIVTGNSSEQTLGTQLKEQFTRSGYVYIITGAALALMALIPGFPSVLLILVGAAFMYFGYLRIKSEKASFEKKVQEEQKARSKKQTGSSPADMSPVAPLEALSLELGIGLLPLVDQEKGAELLERITRIRHESALDLGLVVPAIRIIDNMTLEPEEYVFKIRGIEAGRATIKLGYYMCMDTGAISEEIKGEKTRDPAFGVPAIWVPEEKRAEAERAGYAVVDPPTIIATHLTEIIRQHAADILGREEVSKILNKIKETSPVVVDEVLTTYKYTYGEIEKVLRGLLQEQVSIRDIVTILETLANYGSLVPHNTYMLTEKVREALGLSICSQYVDQTKKLSVLQLSQSWSEKILQHEVVPNDGGAPFVAFDAQEGRKWISSVSSAITAAKEKNFLPIILCAPEVRYLVHSSIDREMPGTVVLSIGEVMAAGHSINLEILGEIDER